MINVKSIRADLGLTQQQLADQVGVTVRAVKQWEQGVRTPSKTAQILLTLLHSLALDSSPRLGEILRRIALEKKTIDEVSIAIQRFTMPLV